MSPEINRRNFIDLSLGKVEANINYYLHKLSDDIDAMPPQQRKLLCIFLCEFISTGPARRPMDYGPGGSIPQHGLRTAMAAYWNYDYAPKNEDDLAGFPLRVLELGADYQEGSPEHQLIRFFWDTANYTYRLNSNWPVDALITVATILEEESANPPPSVPDKPQSRFTKIFQKFCPK